MKRVLITGATGNIGSEVVRFLSEYDTSYRIVVAVRSIDKAKSVFKGYRNLDFVHFDFEDPSTFDKSLLNIDRVFLLRPPHLSDVDKYFRPLICEIKRQGISDVIFLSVQGAEKSKVIPHNKIENLIKEYGLDFIFLRPSYFMQNLTTTLLKDIKNKRQIILPAGKAKFNWIDIENIGEVAALLINKFPEYKNSAYELTGYENLNFYDVVDSMNNIINKPIRYKSVNPMTFYRIKKNEGMKLGMIIVMIFLHFLPRFQNEPKITKFYEQLTNKKPTLLKEFIKRKKTKFE